MLREDIADAERTETAMVDMAEKMEPKIKMTSLKVAILEKGITYPAQNF